MTSDYKKGESQRFLIQPDFWFNDHDRFGSLSLHFPKKPTKFTDEELEWIAIQLEEWTKEFRNVWRERNPHPANVREEVASVEYFETLLDIRTREMRDAWAEVWRLKNKIEELEEFLSQQSRCEEISQE